MKNPLNIRDRLLMAGLHCLPSKLAGHIMFLLRSHPTLADSWGYHVRPIHYYDPLPDFRKSHSRRPNAAANSPPSISIYPIRRRSFGALVNGIVPKLKNSLSCLNPRALILKTITSAASTRHFTTRCSVI